MLESVCRTIVLAALGAALLLQAPERAEARATVDDRQLVSQRRVSRFEFEYSFTLSINNVGTTLDEVRVYVSCDAPGTALTDDVVEFGTIAENQVTISTDTFSLRQDRRVPFDPSCLVFEIGFNTLVRLSGVITDMPIANALVVGTVTHPDSGRPIIESGRPIIEEFSTTADAAGNYELELEATTEDDFITLQAQGVGDQANAVLTSSVGSVGTLTEQGTSGSIVVTSGDNGALNVTHITTAQDELVRRLNGGVLPTTDAALAALQSQVNGAELLVLASVIKTVVDNPGVVNLPAGTGDTLELIRDQQVFDDFLDTLESDPDLNALLVAATQATADALNIGFSPDEIAGPLYTVISKVSSFGKRARVFEFDSNGGGTAILGAGSSDTTWLVNPDGELEVDLLNPPVTETFQFRDDPVFGQILVRALQSVDSIRIVRLANGLTVDQVFILETVSITFPDNPGIPDETVTELPAPELVYIAFTTDGILPVTAEDVAGDRIAAYYYHEDNDAVGFATDTLSTLGADALTFDEDGSGSTARRGFGFTWSAAPDGSLGLLFDNGDSTRAIVYNEDGDVAQALYVGTIAATGETQVFAGEAISFDGVSEFSQPNLENRRYRSLFAVFGENDLDEFDLLFLAGGAGCRLPGGAELRLTWESTADNFMDSFLFGIPFRAPFPWQRRSWQAVDVEPGELGDRYWVIENLDVNGQLDPVYEFSEPTATPGRINAWEFIDDLTGQQDLCTGPVINYDEAQDGDIRGTYGESPVFSLGVGVNTIAGVGNGPPGDPPDPPAAPFDFDVFSIVIPPGRSLVSIALDDWGTQLPVALRMRIREGIQPNTSFQFTVNGGFDPVTGEQATAQSIADDVAQIPLDLGAYTFNNSGSSIDPGVPYVWTFVVQ